MRFKLNAPLLLLLPTIILIVAVIVLPLLLSLYTSLTPFKLTKPETIYTFIGLRNYIRLLTNEQFWMAFGRTFLVLTIALNVEMILGLAIALLVNKVTYGHRTIRTLIMVPMMFSPILVGFQFKFIYNDNVGLLNNALQSLGYMEIIPWLVDGKLALFAILSAEIWSSTPVFAILILAGLMSLPKDPMEAADIDGCTPWQTFRHISLPYLMPFIYIAMTIRSLDIARAYDIVQIMTAGGPAGRTELLWTLISRTGYVDARMGVANAMAYISIILSIVFTYYFFRKIVQSRKYMGGAV